MKQKTTRIDSEPATTDPNLPKVIIAVILTITVGYAFLLILPGLVGGMVDKLGLTAKQAGRVASSQMFGMIIGAFSAPYLHVRFPFRKLLITFSGLIILMDILSGFVLTAERLVIVRLIAGTGAGITTGTATAAIAQMRQPERVASILMAVQFLFGAFSLSLLPNILSSFGIQGAFFSLAALSMLVILSLAAFPRISITAGHPKKLKAEAILKPSFLILLSLLFLYIANNAIWAYLDRLGVAQGINIKAVGIILGASLIAGIIGAGLAFFIAARFGHALPISIGLGGMLFGTWLLIGNFGLKDFLAAAFLLNGSLSFSVVYYLGLCAELDTNGHILSLANFTIIAGLALGPYLGSVFITPNDYNPLLFLSLWGFIVSFLIFQIAIFTMRRNNKPYSELR